MQHEKKVIVVTGPTAVGKTATTVQLSKKLNCSIINADARQFYQELSIGTAKPTVEEMNGVKHYFIDSHTVENPLSAGHFEREALPVLLQCLEKDGCVIVTGGSGLFIQALVEGTHQLPTDSNIRKELEEKLKKHGLNVLQNQLAALDEQTYQSIDIQNPTRVIRAIELNLITGKSVAQLQQDRKPRQRSFTLNYFVLNRPREVLYQRINERVLQMMDKGLVKEVQKNIAYRNLQSLNTVGYKELFNYIDGDISLQEAIEQIQQNTRRYAKRQLTWFRRIDGALWLHPDEAIQKILETI